jgi:hypothetical protein
MRDSTTPAHRSIRPRQLQLEVLEAREVPAYLGELDPSFGTNGIGSASVQINIPNYPVSVVDSSGRTIILSDYEGLTVTRFDANGNLDTTFGQGGSVTVGNSYIGCLGVATDAAGDIAVMGDLGGAGPTLVAMFTSTGAPDTSFGDGGTLNLSTWTGGPAFAGMGLVFGISECPCDHPRDPRWSGGPDIQRRPSRIAQ